MKQCPKCKTVYTDDSLQFCLSDGANLISVDDRDEAAETVRMSVGGAPLRVDIPQNSVPTIFTNAPPVQQAAPNQSAKKKFGIIAAVLIGFFLLLAGIGIAGFVFYKQSGNQNSQIAAASPTPNGKPTASPVTSPKDETEKLKGDLANLQKQLDEQKKQKTNAPANNSAPPSASPQTPKVAKVNSPRDGFLALRSEPDSDTGYRIAQIPHGATLTVLGCPIPSNVGKMFGRWCKVIYEGQSGWAFDAFMTF